MQIVHLQIYGGITDVSYKVNLFQAIDDHVSDHPGGDFGPAKLLQVVFYFIHQPFNGCRGNFALGAGSADAPGQFFAVEFLAGAVLFDDQGSDHDGAFVGGKPLMAVFTLAAASHTTLGIMGGVKNFGLIELTKRTAQLSSPIECSEGFPPGEILGGGGERCQTLPPYMGDAGVSTPYIYDKYSSTVEMSRQEKLVRITLKICGKDVISDQELIRF